MTPAGSPGPGPAAGPDGPARLLGVAVGLLPVARRDWGRAMSAELAAITDRPDRWSFAWGCARAFHPLRAAVHLVVVAGVLVTLLAWTTSVDYPPLAWVLSVVVSVLTVVCWLARRSGMLGPTGDGTLAGVVRAAGYLVAAGIVAAGAGGLRGDGVLVFSTIAASFLIAVATVCVRPSARVLITGIGGGQVATMIWLLVVAVAPPIPASAGSALALTAVAAAGAGLVNSGRGRLIAGLLAATTTMALIFLAVVVLARGGPDILIPDLTPHALPADRIAESRIEIVDPYVLILVLSAVAATALSLAAVLTRRPARPRRT